MSRWILGGVAMGTLLLAGCRDPLSPQEQAIDAAARRWQAIRPASNSYTMQQQVLCFCVTRGAVFDVTVTRGVVSRAVNVETGDALSTDLLTAFRTIDALFTAAREAARTPDQLTALEFDAVAGYPTVLGLDPIKMAVDDEVTYRTQRVVVP